jgi:Domain of unknown function (DUF1918)
MLSIHDQEASMPTTTRITPRSAHVGDWVRARGVHGETAREGEIVEILGSPGHERFRVRWDEQRESILFPADGVTIVPRRDESRSA